MFYKIIIVLLVTCSLLGLHPQSTLSEELQIADMPYTIQINHFANLYGVDSRLVSKVIECESGGKHSSNGDGGRSHGIAQIQKPTWDWMEKMYQKEYNEDLNYNSAFDQIKLTTYMISKGEGHNWTTYVAIQKGGKYSFYSSQMKRHYTVYCKL